MVGRPSDADPNQAYDVWSGLTEACLVVERDGTVRHANEAACQLLRMDQDSLVEKSFVQLVRDVDLVRLREGTTRLAAGYTYRLTGTLLLGDGSSCPADIIALPAMQEGEIVSLVILSPARDQATAGSAIRQRERQLEDLYLASALASSHRPLQELLDEISSQVCTLTRARSSGLYIHDRVRDVLVLRAAHGVPQSSVGTELRRDEGLAWQCFTSGDSINTARYDNEPNALDLDSTFGLGSDRYQTIPIVVVPMVWRGENIGVMALGEPESGEAFGSSDEYIGQLLANQVAVAIEQSRLYEEAQTSAQVLARANQELQQLDQIKSDFMAMVSHELQRPLATARLGIDLVLEDCQALRPRHAKLLERSVRGLDALASLLSDILFLGELSDSDASRDLADLGNVVCVAYDKVAPKARAKGLAMRLDSAPVPLPVSVPPRALVRIVEHLLDNAHKFTASGSITVRTAEESDHAHATLTVIDTGIGISDEQQRRIFGPYYQADSGSRRAHDGMGLGLALVRRVVEVYGGRIEVESEPGSGSRFVLRLALADDAWRKDSSESW